MNIVACLQSFQQIKLQNMLNALGWKNVTSHLYTKMITFGVSFEHILL